MTTETANSTIVPLRDLVNCFGGAIPSVMCTASADGVPNVIYFSRAHFVDDERIALSNHFLSKTARNLAEHPFASVLLVDPTTHDEFRLSLRYERTERRGPVFERLRMDVELLSKLTGQTDLMHLRAADVYRVLDIERCNDALATGPVADVSDRLDRLGVLGRRITRASHVDDLVDVVMRGLDTLLGFDHVSLLIADTDAGVLSTVATVAYPEERIGSEIRLGEGHLGLIAERCESERIGGLKSLRKYSLSVHASTTSGPIGPGHSLSLPTLDAVDSQLVVPVLAFGELVALIVAESDQPMTFTADDERTMSVVAAMLGPALASSTRVESPGDQAASPAAAAPAPSSSDSVVVSVRFFEVDGSVFVDDDYLIKGVAGRIFRRLVGDHVETGRREFTNRELRLDPSLQLPGFKDNLESRLMLLRRRLDDCSAHVRIERTGRGRFRIEVDPTVSFRIVDET